MKRPPKIFLIIVGLAGFALLASTSLFVVEESDYAVVTRFGRMVAIHDEPGLKPRAPFWIDRVTSFDKRSLYQPIPESEYLTADKKNILVDSYVTWRIVRPDQFLTALRNRYAAETRIESLVKAALGAALGERPFTDYIPNLETGANNNNQTAGASSNIAKLEGLVLQQISSVAERDYGLKITTLGISSFSFPQQNLNSVFARMRAERQRIAQAHRSEGKAESKKIVADAKRQSAEIVAKAEAQAEITRGKAEAEAAKIYAQAYEGYEDFYTFTRTLELYDKVIDKDTTVVISDDSPLLDLLTKPLKHQP